MIEELFRNNKLEYVYVLNDNKDSNIAGDMTLSKNIEELRYMDIHQYKRGKYDIRLDISEHFPTHLRVFYVKTNGRQSWRDPDDIQYGTIQGAPDQIARLTQQLVHELPENP